MTSGERQSVDLLPSTVIAERYVVLSLLGKGGMAAVYLCSDLRDGSRVAVKVLRQEIGSSVVVDRFLREIALSSNLKHSSIPQVLDSGVIDELPFYVMTYIEGESLRARLDREKQLSVAETIRIATGIAEPMAHAHSLGIIHRDIKPANVLLSSESVYVLDFGIARAILQSADDRLTSTGVAVGTPAYMSPEQALADSDLDARSDVYSLGCVTYEMIAGIPPFVGATSQAVMARRFASVAPPLSETRDGIPNHVEAAVAKALMRAPVDRWQTAQEFATALRAAPSPLNSSGFSTVFAKLRKRRRLLATGIGIPLLAMTTAALVWVSGVFPGRTTERVLLDPRRIAVLYFDDHSSDRSLGYLASGLTEGLIQELSAVPALRVVSLNGVKTFKERAVPLDSIATVLAAGTIVEGSVQRSGSRLRVRAQIVNGNTSTPIEGATIEREMGELFQLQDDLADRVSRLLRRRIGREITLRETEAATKSARARSLVFRANEAREEAENETIGGSIGGRRSLALLREADSLLQQAEKADTKWLGPVIGRGWVAFDAGMRSADDAAAGAFRDAIEHANRALLKNPSSATALELRGTALYFSAVRRPRTDPEFKASVAAAEADLKRAVSLDSTLASAWGALSLVHVSGGELLMAERAARIAFAADAYLKDAPKILRALYLAELMADHPESAWQWCLRGARDFAADPQFVDCRLTLLAEDTRKRPNPTMAWDLVSEGERLESRQQAIAAGRPYLPIYRMMQAAVVSARAGDTDRARTVAARARSIVEHTDVLRTDFKYDDAFLQLVLGDQAAAIKILSEYLADRSSRVRIIAQHPRWKPLRSNPDFEALLRRNLTGQ